MVGAQQVGETCKATKDMLRFTMVSILYIGQILVTAPSY
jgi:hypothetical protein